MTAFYYHSMTKRQNNRLTGNDLIREGQTGEAYIKSVINPSAQSLTLCATRFKEFPEFDSAYSCFMSNHDKAIGIKAITELIFTWGLRVSEVLNIKGSDILHNGLIRVQGKKGSLDRIIYSPSYSEYFKMLRVNGGCTGNLCSRYYLYREFKKAGLYSLFGANRNYSVTHYARHRLGLMAQDGKHTLGVVKSVLGHKKESSSEYYVKKKK